VTYDELVELFGAKGGKALCPAHDDHHPSMTIAKGRDCNTVVKCHAGHDCTTAAICAAKGITMADLYDGPRTNGEKSKIVATYDYVDENGDLLFQAVRFDPKKFRQRRPDGRGGWNWSLGDTRRVLFRLPELLDGIAAGEQVWIAEGEKDVTALVGAGVVATCNPMGAGTWRPEYTAALIDAKDVMIVADKDKAGYDHALAVAAALESPGRTITVVEAASGHKDAAEHLGAGRSIAEFITARPVWEAELEEQINGPFALNVVSLAVFAKVDEKGAESLLGDASGGVIPAGADVMIYGDGGAGKTTLGLDLGCHLAIGADWLTIPIPKACKVLTIENEGPRPLFRTKVAAKLAAWAEAGRADPGDGFRIVDEPWARFDFTNERHRAALAEFIAAHEIDLVLVGPVVMAGMTEAGTLQEVRAFLAHVADVRARASRPVAFVLVHHENRAGKVSGAWEGAVDTLLHVTGMGNGRTRLHFQKARWASDWHGKTLELRWEPGASFGVDDTPKMTDDDIAEQLLAFIGDHAGTSSTDALKAITGVGDKRVRTVRDRMLKDRQIVNKRKIAGVEQLLDECKERTTTALYLADDPTIRHLRQSPAADQPQIAAALEGF
jgi:hypothetical protein